MWERGRSTQERLYRRLLAAGCPLHEELAEETATAGLLIEQSGEAHLYEVWSGGTAILMHVSIARVEPGEATIADFGDIRGPWGVWSPVWQTPLPAREHVYRLANGFGFERDLVLNDQLGEAGIRLRRGCRTEGYVLGYVLGSIPVTMHHGEMVDGIFSVVDVLGYESTAEVRFMIDRSDAKEACLSRSARHAVQTYTSARVAIQRMERESIFAGTGGNWQNDRVQSTQAETDKASKIPDFADAQNGRAIDE